MYKNIMLAVNLDHRSSWVGSLPVALSFVEKFSCKLTVITVALDFSSSFVSSFFPQDFQEKMIEQTRLKLKTLVDQQIPSALHTKIQSVIGFGAVEDEIIHYVKKLNIDLLIMSDYRAKYKKGMFGHPHITAIKNHIDCSILIDRN